LHRASMGERAAGINDEAGRFAGRRFPSPARYAREKAAPRLTCTSAYRQDQPRRSGPYA